MRKIAAALRPERGNVFTLMLGAVALLGTLGYATQVMITGPVSAMAKAHNETMARYSMRLAAQLIIANTALNSSADCDSDSRVEPMVFKTGTGPTGGGQIPDNVTTQNTDPWGNVYGYCVWDMGNVADDNDGSAADGDCGTTGGRLNGNDDPVSGNVETQTVFALVSSGPNRIFETTCANYSNGTTPVVSRGGDDLVMEYTYMEAGAASFGSSGGGGSSADGVWALKTGDSTTAETEKNLEIGSSATINVSAGSGVFDVVSVTDTLTASGGLKLSQISTTTCPEAGTLRYNSSTRVVEYCDASNAWASLLKDAGFLSPWSQTTTLSTMYLLDKSLIVNQPTSAQALTASGSGTRMVWYPDKVAFRSGLAKNDYWDDANIGTGSIAVGARTMASGNGSIAMGGDSSGGTNATGADGPIARGRHSVAIGINAQTGASAVSAFAQGKGSSAAGNGSVAIGENAVVSGAGTTGRGSVAIGANVTVSGTRSTAIGSRVTVSGNNTFAIGLKTSGAADTVTMSNGLAITGPVVVNNTSRVNTGASDALEVTTWSSRKPGGGTWAAISSDARLKNIMGPFTAGLSEIKKINTFRFHFRKDNPLHIGSENEQIGYTAQNIGKTFPAALIKNSTAYPSLDSNFVSYAIINSLKEMKTRNDILQKRADTLKKDIARLEEIVNAPQPSTKFRLTPFHGATLATALLALYAAFSFYRRNRKQ